MFSKTRLEEGGEASKYYPLSEEGRREYQEWYSRQSRAWVTKPPLKISGVETLSMRTDNCGPRGSALLR